EHDTRDSLFLPRLENPPELLVQALDHHHVGRLHGPWVSLLVVEEQVRRHVYLPLLEIEIHRAIQVEDRGHMVFRFPHRLPVRFGVVDLFVRKRQAVRGSRHCSSPWWPPQVRSVANRVRSLLEHTPAGLGAQRDSPSRCLTRAQPGVTLTPKPYT